MKRGRVDIVNKLGLHARAASRLVNTAKAFAASIELKRPNAEGDAADAKRIMAVLMLEATCDTTLELACEGVDEAEAFAAVSALIADRFGEAE